MKSMSSGSFLQIPAVQHYSQLVQRYEHQCHHEFVIVCFIWRVPALMLDCDANIDFSRDIEAKTEYAKQVAEFFEYVQRTKESLGGSHHLMVPQSGGLLGPDGSQLLSRNPLEAGDFSQQMSSYCL
jgi:hypothetical protein